MCSYLQWLYSQDPINVVSWHQSAHPRIMFIPTKHPPSPDCILDFIGVTQIHYVGMHGCSRITSLFSQKSLVTAGSSSNIFFFNFPIFFHNFFQFSFLKMQQTLCFPHISWLYSVGWFVIASAARQIQCACLCCFIQPQGVAWGRRAWAISVQNFPWVSAFAVSLEPVRTAHWICTNFVEPWWCFA